MTIFKYWYIQLILLLFICKLLLYIFVIWVSTFQSDTLSIILFSSFPVISPIIVLLVSMKIYRATHVCAVTFCPQPKFTKENFYQCLIVIFVLLFFNLSFYSNQEFFINLPLFFTEHLHLSSDIIQLHPWISLITVTKYDISYINAFTFANILSRLFFTNLPKNMKETKNI